MRQLLTMICATVWLSGCVYADECVSGAARSEDGQCTILAADADVPIDSSQLDMGLEEDGDMTAASDMHAADAQADAGQADIGADPDDAGASPDMPLGDAGPCPGAVAYDDVVRRCLYRVEWTGGPLCPEGMQPLRWGLVEGQQRMEMLYRSAGALPGGVGLQKIDDVWTWVETGVAPPGGILEWAAGEPSAAAHEYAYLAESGDGLHSRFEPHPWQLCMGPVL